MRNALTSAQRQGVLFPWTWLAGFALSSLFAACGGGGGSGGSMNPPAVGSYTASSGAAQKGPVTATTATLEAIAIAPASPATGIGLMRQLAVTGTYSDGTTADITNRATWMSSAPAVASIGGSTGLVTGISLGSTNITATIGSLTNTVALRVVTNSWTPAASMFIPHADHTATLLTDGRLLVLGGLSASPTAVAETEIYHPLSDTWTPAASVPTALMAHAATALKDGTVLVTGGGNDNGTGAINSVEIYDPVANTWIQGPPMQSARWFHTATLLANGKVLVVGNGGRIPPSSADIAEIYDPVAKTWSPAAPLPAYRSHHTATLLTDGRVLVVGGYWLIDPSYTTTACASAPVVYAPASDQWIPTGSLVTPTRCDHTATLLANGKVLIAGGDDGSGTPLASTEIYDPTANTWSPGPSLLVPRLDASATLLPNGKILITGGLVLCPPTICPPPAPGTVNTMPTPTSELVDPVANMSTMTASLNQARLSHTATLAPNGVVLVVGGWGVSNAPYEYSPTATAELYW